MSYQITKREARDSDFITLKSKATGDLVRIVSPHDFHVGIEGLKPSDVKVLGDVYITGSLYIKGGATGSMHLPDGNLVLEAGSGISVTESPASGRITIATTGGGSGGAPDNAKYLLLQSYSPAIDLPDAVVLTANSPISLNSSTGEISLDSTISGLTSLSATSLAADTAAFDAINIGGFDFSNMEIVTYGDGFAGTGGPKNLTAGSGINVSNATVSVDATVVRTSGTTFTGDVNASRIISTAFSGSLTKLSNGSDYLVAGTNVTLSTSSDGSVTISAPSVGGAPVDADYLVVGPTSAGSLGRERTLSMGAGLAYSDSGANGSYTLRVLDSEVAFLTGANFSGPVTASNLKSNDIYTTRITGSLTRLSNGDPYLVAGSNVTISTGSDGSVTVSAPSLVSSTSPFLLRSYDASLPNSLVLTHGAGIDIIEDGFGNFEVIADLIAGPGVTITELPGGELEISAGTVSATGGGDPDAQYLVLSSTGSLTQERVLTLGLGLSSVDSGPNGSYTLGVRDDIFATLTGSVFVGDVIFEAGVSGSITSLSNGDPYIRAGSNVTVLTGADGSITISATVSTSSSGVAASVSMNESLSGVQDGSNLVFTLAHEPSPVESLMLFYNGQLLTRNGDYTVSGSSVSFTPSFVAPATDDVIRALYTYSSTLTQYAFNESVSFTFSGTEWQAVLLNAPSPSNSLMLFMNGQLLTEGIGSDYLLSGQNISIEPGLFDVGASVFFATYQY